MSLRAAQASDAAAICDIWNAVIRDTTITFTTVQKTNAQIKAMISERGKAFVVATQDQNVTGFATFGPFRQGPGYADVVEHSVYLSPAAQGAGQGYALMARLCAIARGQGKRIMVAAITGSNADAIAFHTKLGFEQVGYMPDVGRKFGALHDLCWMQKNL